MTSATSNTLGAYSLANLPAGTYRVRADAPPNHAVTTPPSGVATVTVTANQPAVAGVNFGIRAATNIWHNVARPYDVNDSGQAAPTPIDALLVINWINTHPSMPDLPPSGSPEIDGYIDVNDDSRCTPLDALLIFNQLNSPPGGGGEGEGGGGEGEGEGEAASATPRTAAEYYAQNPIHFLEIAGADLPCGCEECSASTTSPVNAVSTASNPVSAASSSAATVAGPVALPLASAAWPLLSQISTADGKLTTLATTARERLLPRPAAAVRRHLASPPTAAKPEAATAAAPPCNLDAAVEAIAADVSRAQAERPLQPFARRPRARG
jgi:hypothetical protein